jgi:P-type E1-E2 ATPase
MADNVMRRIEIPGKPALELTHLVLDVNGTLTNRGELIDGVDATIRRLKATLDVHLVSADTFGSLCRLAKMLGVYATLIVDGSEKAAFVHELGSRHCVAIGNGANDTEMLRMAALAIAVIGREGAAATTVAAADIVCASIGDALGLLVDDQALAGTLRP